MKRRQTFLRFAVIILALAFSACSNSSKHTTLYIRGNKFYINGVPTYQGKSWNGNSIEGLLFNARMVQAIFDDSNTETSGLWKYPDTGEWDPDRNTNEFVTSMDQWHQHGLLAFTVNLQGGSPVGYGNRGWINSAFNPDGSLKKKYFTRLHRVLKKADELGMVVIVGLFYFGQDEILDDETAVINAVNNFVDWMHSSKFRNVLIEVNNECDVNYDHEILGPARVSELITLIKENEREGFRFYAGTSFGGGVIPSRNVVAVSDFLLLHGNGVEDPGVIREMVRKTRIMPEYNAQPILFNEDDHYAYDQDDFNLKAAVESYASWGYFDYRREGESFEEGFQSVPVDWTINSDRKKDYFNMVKKITGGFPPR